MDRPNCTRGKKYLHKQNRLSCAFAILVAFTFVVTWLMPLSVLFAQEGGKPKILEMSFLNNGDLVPLTKVGEDTFPSTGNADITIQLKFDQEMEPSQPPTFTFGWQPPYNIPIDFGQSARLFDNRIWQVTITINPDVPTEDGLYTFRVSNARSVGEGGMLMDPAQSDAVFTRVYDITGQRYPAQLYICRFKSVEINPVNLNFPLTNALASSDRVFKIINAGCVAIDILDIVPPSQFTVLESVNRQIPGYSESSFTLRFIPTRRDTFSTTAQVFIKDLPTREISVTASSRAPEIAVLDENGLSEIGQIDFGERELNTSISKTIRIKNIRDTNPLRNADLRIESVNTTNESFKTTTFSATLKPDEFQNLTITFTPTAKGLYDALLRIYNNDPDEAPKTIRLLGTGIGDRNPPSRPLEARILDWYYYPYTNAGIIRVSWRNPFDPSGIKEVRWKIGARPESPIDTTHSKTLNSGSPTFNVVLADSSRDGWGLLRNGWQVIYFWLCDGEGNIGWQNYATVWFRYDGVAPGIPSQPRIRTGSWTRDDTISVWWTHPARTPDLAEVRWKLKTRPTSPTDFTEKTVLGNLENHRFIINFKGDQKYCGTDTCFFWLADSAGNANYRNLAWRVYRYDICPPEISRTSNKEAVALKHTAFVDTIKIIEHNPVDWDSVVFRFGGACATEPPSRLKRLKQEPLPDKRTQYTYIMEIPGSGVTTRGIEYKVSAKDTLNNTGYGPQGGGSGNYCYRDGYFVDEVNYWYPIRVRFTGEGEFRIDKDGNAIPQPYGRDQESYTLFSVPFDLTDPSPKAVLEDDLGSYNIKKWRLFEYRTEKDTTYEYKTAPANISFKPGRAFFLIVGDPDKIIDSGIGKTVSTKQAFVDTLQEGWNLFANPFNFPVGEEGLELINSGIPLSLRSFERWWNIDDVIEPWKGYAIYVERLIENQPIRLLIHPIATDNRRYKPLAPTATAPGEWTLQISASAGAALDTINWVGARNTAAEEYDHNDLFEPPVIGEYVSVYFPNENWSLHPMKYTADFRPTGEDSYEWPLVVASNHANGEVVLQFKGLGTIAAEYEVYLVDEQYGVARNLRHNPHYQVRTGANGVKKSLKLMVGAAGTLGKLSGGISLTPKNFELSQNFPNPFSRGAAVHANPLTEIRYALPQTASVTVEVYNMLGQRVRTLVAGQKQAADYYLVTWDGHDEFGREVASGVYVYRLLAETGSEKFTATKKLLLVK
jgi:hypothetical protein